jgi:hypothetical protein
VPHFPACFPAFCVHLSVRSVLRRAGSLARYHLPTKKLRRGTPLRSSLPYFAANVPSPELSLPYASLDAPLRSFAAAFVSAILRQSADPSASSVLPAFPVRHSFSDGGSLSPSAFARRLRRDKESERPEIGPRRPPAQTPGRSSGFPPRQIAATTFSAESDSFKTQVGLHRSSILSFPA